MEWGLESVLEGTGIGFLNHLAKKKRKMVVMMDLKQTLNSKASFCFH